jgi:hypothetical protein
VDLVLVAKLSITLLEMLDPVKTCVLNFWRETFLYSTTLYVSYNPTGGPLLANVSLKRCRHQLYAVIG